MRIINIILLVVLPIYKCSSTPMNSITNERSFQNQILLDKAWNLPIAKLYQKHFEYQKTLTSCGPTTIENALFSFGIPDYTQDNLFSDETLSFSLKVKTQGMTLDELGEVVKKKSNKKVNIVRDISLPEFKEIMRKANDPSKRVLINFHRKPLFGKGGGHHSPIGGYLEADNLVFVLDVNKTYKPFLVTPERLFESINGVDSENNKKRGLVIVDL
jgi:hypothetical protein